MKRAAIYRIINTTNGKVYIGSSKDAPKRLYRHGWMLRGGRHDNNALQKAWDKDGPDVFKFEVIEYVDDAATILIREQFWIDKLRAGSHWHGYNACPVAGTREGTKQSPEMVAKLSAFHKGKPKTAEQRAKMSASALGRKKSSEHKQRLREAAQRQFTDPEARLKAAEYARMAKPHMTGKSHSPEARAKISAAHILRLYGPNGKPVKIPREKKPRILGPHTEAWKQNHSAKLTGRPRFDKRTPSPEKILEYKAAKAAGASYAEMEKQFGVNRATLHKYIST